LKEGGVRGGDMEVVERCGLDRFWSSLWVYITIYDLYYYLYRDIYNKMKDSNL